MSEDTTPPRAWDHGNTPPFGVALPRAEDVPAHVAALRMQMIGVEGMLRDQIRDRKAQAADLRAIRNSMIGLVGALLVAAITAAITVGGYLERVDSHDEDLRTVKAQLREVEKTTRAPWHYRRESVAD